MLSSLDQQEIRDLVSVIAREYNLTMIKYRFLSKAVSDVFRIDTTGGTLFLKVYPPGWRTVREIDAELDFVEYLAHRGLGVAIPVVRSNGSRFIPLTLSLSERYAVLFDNAGDKRVNYNESKGRMAFGKTLGKFHILAAEFPQRLNRPQLSIETLTREPWQAVVDGGYLSHGRREDWEFIGQSVERVYRELDALSTHLPAQQLIHGDARNINSRMRNGDEVTLFDFDLCGYGWPAYDIATFMVDFPKDWLRDYLASYQSERVLTAYEYRALPFFEAARNIWQLGLRARIASDTGNSAFFNDRDMVHSICENIEKALVRDMAL
ncbi:MAG TPA: phosphotransferase [Chloroflexia bacterium]